MKTTVSVIIPFYHGEQWLREAIDSVIAQTYQPLEIVVMDDGSPEDISSVVLYYKDKIRYFRQENGGPAVARNNAISMSKGEYVAFLDADDLWLPNKLEDQLNLMKKENFVWSCTAYKTFGSNDEIIVYPFATSNLCYEVIYNSAKIGTPTVIIKKDVLDSDVNLRFEDEFRYGEDTLLWIKLANKYPLGVVDYPLCKVRIRGTNANLSGRVHINTRNDLWSKLTENNLNIVPPKRHLTRLGYQICKLEGKLIKNRKFPNTVCKALYAFPWLLFSVDNYFLKRKLRKIKVNNF